jgi:hypothetical protein
MGGQAGGRDGSTNAPAAGSPLAQTAASFAWLVGGREATRTGQPKSAGFRRTRGSSSALWRFVGKQPRKGGKSWLLPNVGVREEAGGGVIAQRSMADLQSRAHFQQRTEFP